MQPRPRPPAPRLRQVDVKQPLLGSLGASTIPTPSQSLQHKLSSSSLCTSQPPDSPPMTFDQLDGAGSGSDDDARVLFPRGRERSPSSGRSSKGHQEHPAMLNASSIPHNKPIPFPTSATPSAMSLSARARTLSQRSRSLVQDFAGLTGATPVAGMAPPPLSRDWLGKKSREELEELLTEADRVIRERQTDLELVADIGKSLLEENNALRSRQDSLVNHSISPTKAFRPSSSRPSDPRPAGSPRPWRNSLNFPPPALSPRSKGLDASEEGTWHDNTPSSPTTPLRFTHRHRMSSSASISSLFAPSPRNVSSPAPQEVQALSQANYALLLQLTELEADSEKTQRDGNRKLRKLERELLALRQELSRAEERNDALEDVKEVGSGNEGRGETYRDWSKEEGGRIRDDEDESTPTFVRTKPTSPQDNAPALELPALHFAPATPPTHTTPTPVNASRRTPGDGRPRTPLSLVDSPVLPQTPDQTQDELVGLLMSKIDELREANEIITEERIDMVERLEQAQKDVDDFRRKCDELEDDLVQTIGWKERQGEIGWRDEDAFSDTSPVRLKGNRRLIEQRKRTNIDTDFPFSNSDTSLSSTASDPYPNREREDSLESSRFFSDKLKRSLESELGSEWHHESSDDDNEHEEGSSATGSTSTPAKTLHAAYVSELDLDTSSEIFPHGSLRYSGPPDSETYEHLTRVVANLPAVWEDEKKFGRSPPPATGLLRSLPWAQESEDFWDESQYPELEETDFDRLESAEAVEQRRSRRASGSRSRSFSGTRIGSRMLRSRKRGGHSQAGGAAAIVSDDEGLPLSRREQALLRLGIYSSGEESGEERDEDVESVMSDFEHLERDGKRSADYWPVALRARYAPRMIATRAADSAVQHALLMITYIRFFLVLAVALAFALWQGPKKTMGMREGRRRLR